MKIRVVDFYEETEVIGTAYSMSEASAIWQAREEDTDGECAVRCFLEEDNAKPKDVTHIVASYCPDAHY